jgi:hypothetical protein
MWKDLIASVKGLISDSGQSDTTQSQRPNVEEKISQIISNCKQLEKANGEGAATIEQFKSTVLKLLTEVEKIMENENLTVEEDRMRFYRSRSLLLELWKVLLNELNLIYKATKHRGTPKASAYSPSFAAGNVTLFHKVIRYIHYNKRLLLSLLSLIQVLRNYFHIFSTVQF